MDEDHDEIGEYSRVGGHLLLHEFAIPHETLFQALKYFPRSRSFSRWCRPAFWNIFDGDRGGLFVSSGDDIINQFVTSSWVFFSQFDDEISNRLFFSIRGFGCCFRLSLRSNFLLKNLLNHFCRAPLLTIVRYWSKMSLVTVDRKETVWFSPRRSVECSRIYFCIFSVLQPVGRLWNWK